MKTSPRPGMTSLNRPIIPVDGNVDQKRRVALQTLRDEIGGVMHGGGAFRGNAKRARQPDVIDRWILKLHADKAVDLRGEPRCATRRCLRMR